MPQARVAGTSLEIVLVDVARTTPLASLGNQAPEKRLWATRFSTAAFSQAAPRRMAKKLVSKLRASFGCDPDRFPALGYAPVQVAANESRSADGDRRKIGDAHSTRNPPSILGQGQFSIKPTTRNPTCGVVLLKWSQRCRRASEVDKERTGYRAELKLVRLGLAGGPLWLTLRGKPIKSRLTVQRRVTPCE